jgi:hypothetical protein
VRIDACWGPAPSLGGEPRMSAVGFTVVGPPATEQWSGGRRSRNVGALPIRGSRDGSQGRTVSAPAATRPFAAFGQSAPLAQFLISRAGGAGGPSGRLSASVSLEQVDVGRSRCPDGERRGGRRHSVQSRCRRPVRPVTGRERPARAAAATGSHRSGRQRSGIAIDLGVNEKPRWD